MIEEELAGATDSKGSGDDDDLLAPSTLQEDQFEQYDGDYQAEDEDDEDEDFVATSTASSSSTSRKRRQPAAKKSATTKAKKGGARGASKAKGSATTATRRASKRRRKSDDLEDDDDVDEDGDYLESSTGSSRRGAPPRSSDARHDELRDAPHDEDPTMDPTMDPTTTTTSTSTSTSTSCVSLGGVGSCSGGRTCGGRGPSLARLPMLCREVLRCLPPPQPELEGNEALPYDPDAIQVLVLDLAVDPALHAAVAVDTVDNVVVNTVDSGGNSAADAERRVVAEAVRRVAASTSAGGRRYRLPQRDGYDRRAVLALYEAFLASPKQQKKRSYRMEGAPDLRSLWTEERIARFQIAFRKYGYSPTSNRKIAEAIGEGIHANHVADFKRRYKKVLIKEGRLDELKSISGIRMKKIEQKMNQLRSQQEQRQQKKNNKTNKTKKTGTRVSKRALAAAAAAEAEAASAGLVDAVVNDDSAVVGMVADVSSSSDALAPA